LTQVIESIYQTAMILLDEAIEAKKYDTRVIETNLGRGVISQAEAKTFVSELPDDSANAEWVTLEKIAQHEGAGKVEARSDKAE
jgi:polyhydroxyalkanoate synthesis regulator phasin